jgi:two-component system autoinducer 2 sensor kinase/phosphatase LuxQ
MDIHNNNDDLSDDQQIIISIIDNNNHIQKNIKDKLFQPFNSTSGSGLGLYICKKIIELHNGVIRHDYLENIGNKFSIFLMLKKYIDVKLSDSIKNNATPRSKKYIETKSSDSEDNNQIFKVFKKEKIYNIIIIDDSSLNIKMMYKILKGYPIFNKVISAVDGLDAINKIYNNLDNIDVVLIDNEMPNLNGIQTIKLLRGINFNKLIFGITGSYNNQFGEFSNCVDYLFSKPFDMKKIDILLSFLEKNDINRYQNKKLQLVGEELVWM